MPETDFLIIGGGIAGISTAARLSELGSVQLLEAEDGLGFHASGRSAAMFLAGYGNDVVKALNRASADHHRNANGGVLSPRGVLSVAKADQEEAFRHEMQEFSMPEISVAEALRLVPILNSETVTFAALDTSGSDLDTDLLLQNFVKNCRKNGGQIATGQRVKGILGGTNSWRVTTNKGEYSGRILVNAAGAWVDEIAKMAGVTPLGFQPLRRSIARLPAPGGHDVTGWPMLHSAADEWYAKPDAGKWLVSPSEADPVEAHDAFVDDMVLAEGLDRYSRMVTTPVTRVETSWAGLRTFSPDSALVIGFDAKDRDFLWVAGQGGYGFQTAPAASQLAAELVNGQSTTLSPDIVRALSPARF